MKSNFIIVCYTAFFLVCNNSFAQDNSIITSLDVCLNPKTLVEKDSESTTIWTEDESVRTLMSSMYYSNDGQIKTRQSSRAINYYNQLGELKPIISEMQSLGEANFAALQQPYPTYYNEDASISLTLANKNHKITFGKNCRINGQLIGNDFEFDGKTSTISNVIPRVDKEVIFRENGAKSNYILMQAMTNLQEAVIFSEEIEIPEGYTISEDLTRGERTEYGWSGLLIVKDPSGKIVSTFHEPLCFDQSRSFMVASYRIKKENGKHIIEMVVDADWLDDPARVYPVIIDPIVQGPTSTWAGGMMPSCFMPAYNQDSILITIPANVTVTELNVTASFQAVSPAWMADGSMFFSTDCANTGTFTVQGAQGQFPGTGSLASTNLYNPLTCCYPESCNPQTFWLSYHIGRNTYGPSCNTSYVRYNPATTSPFEATVIGKTAEHSVTAGGWNVSGVPKCSNDCDITGVAYASYGVPPFTFTHPWSTDTVVLGTNVGCSNGSTSHLFHLTPPNCPNYCDTVTTTLSVPPPVITDACGNLVAAAAAESVPLKPAPGFNPVYDTLVCSGEPFVIDLNLCIPQAVMQWDGNGVSGWNDQISQTLSNNSENITTVNYSAFALYNGCKSDTIDLSVYVQPLPIPNYMADPEPGIVALPIEFTDMSTFNASPGVLWFYTFGDGDLDVSENPIHTYPEPGEYEVCLYVENAAGCADSLCKILPVAPAEVHIPNIVTPNGDGINDLLEFQYLEFYPDNHLSIINRWGVVIYEKTNYENDWNGSAYSEGTYFFYLRLTGTDKEYSGFIQVVH